MLQYDTVSLSRMKVRLQSGVDQVLTTGQS